MESTEQEESEDSEGDVSDMDADIEYSDPPEVRQKSSSEMDHELGKALEIHYVAHRALFVMEISVHMVQ